MARQIAQVPVTGTLGDITFYKTTESGFLARMKTDLDAERLKNDPLFENSRKAYTDFGKAGAGAGLLRTAMLAAGRQLSDTRIISRLTGKLTGIIATDKLHLQGERQLDDADLSGLIGFEWNKHQSLGALCRFTPSYRIDKATGLMEIDIPALSVNSFKAPAGATHYELVLDGAGGSFTDKKAVRATDTTGWNRLNATEPARTLRGSSAKTDGRWMMLGLGVRFGQEVNGKVDPLEDQTAVAFLIGAMERW
jgi:hypothetical protein